MEESNPINQYKQYVGVKFSYTTHAYFFGVKDLDVQVGDKVVVETTHGPELGEVAFEPIDISQYKSELLLRPILRKATDTDIKLAEINEKDAIFAMEICKSEVEKAGLDMSLISCEYTLDKGKVVFTYVADERVDFRELLKALASKLHTRIELRQIGSRDKAKLVGGLGMCGLPLCCSSFLNEFDGISITRAKNQMLAINIPKLSGHCGKLMCCLKYEDDAYTDLKTLFPDVGSKWFIDKVEYTVTSINVISSTVRVENEEDAKVLSLEDFMSQTGFRNRNSQEEKKEFNKNRHHHHDFRNKNRNNNNEKN